LVGILSPGAKVSASASNVLAYLGGKHVGHRQGKETWIDPTLDGEMAASVSQGLRGFFYSEKTIKSRKV